MTTQELIELLSKITDKSTNVYMRIGGLPLVEVTDMEVDKAGDIILFELN